MKKIVYTIGILMFLSGPLHPWIGQAADNPQEQSCNVLTDPSCRLSTRIEYALRGEGNKGLDWGQSFGATDPKEVGQNLYLMVYEKAQTKTLGAAIKATAEQYGMPPERMALILEGDITPIMERSPMMRIDQAIQIYNSMVATYNDKKNSLDVQATVNAKIEPNEMFADGDLSNSGFDLINDLNNIEIILFKKNDPVTFGGQYSAAESSGGSTTPGGTTPAGSQVPGGALPVDISGTPSGKVPTARPGAASATKPLDQTKKPPIQNPFQAAGENKSGVFAGGINPNQCFASQGIDKAMNNFVTEAASNPKLQSTFAEKSSGGAGATAGATGTPGAAGTSGVPAGLGDLTGDAAVAALLDAATDPPIAPPASAPADDYSTPPLCGDVICVTLDFIEKPATAAFNKTDNCIQCHVQFINESLQKTISHSLIPAKATGNLGESGLCKNASGKALGAVGMNVSVNFVPVITPVKDDLITLGNITDEWDKYAELNGAWKYNEKKRKMLEAQQSGQPEAKTPSVPEIEKMLEVELANAPDGATQAQVADKAAQAFAAQKTTEAQQMLVAEIAKDAYSEVDTYKALDDEMKAMNQAFDGFRKQILTLLVEVPGLVSSKSCEKLKHKEACT